MYMVRTEMTVVPGGTREFEDLATGLGDLRKRLDPSSAQTLLRSYGRPSTYAIISRYSDVQAAWKFSNSTEFAGFVRQGPPGLFTMSRPQEGYESVYEVDADTMPATLDCEVFVDWHVRIDRTQAFEQSRREVFELRKRHQAGYATNRVRRNAGARTRYVIIQVCADYDSAVADLGPEVAAFAAAHGPELYCVPGTLPNAEVFHVVHRK